MALTLYPYGFNCNQKKLWRRDNHPSHILWSFSHLHATIKLGDYTCIENSSLRMVSTWPLIFPSVANASDLRDHFRDNATSSLTQMTEDIMALLLERF